MGSLEWYRVHGYETWKVRLDQNLIEIEGLYLIGDVDPLKNHKLRILSDLFYYFIIYDS